VTASDVSYLSPTGKMYHSRALRVKYNGDYKPFVKQLRKWHESGELKEIILPGKHIYTYTLKGRHVVTNKNYPKMVAGINKPSDAFDTELSKGRLDF
jgi:hypothetical protein